MVVYKKVRMVFVLRITLRGKKGGYLYLSRAGFKMVTSKIHAYRFEQQWMAQWVSDRFWENHWDKKLYEAREIIAIETSK